MLRRATTLRLSWLRPARWRLLALNGPGHLTAPQCEQCLRIADITQRAVEAAAWARVEPELANEIYDEGAQDLDSSVPEICATIDVLVGSARDCKELASAVGDDLSAYDQNACRFEARSGVGGDDAERFAAEIVACYSESSHLSHERFCWEVDGLSMVDIVREWDDSVDAREAELYEAAVLELEALQAEYDRVQSAAAGAGKGGKPGEKQNGARKGGKKSCPSQRAQIPSRSLDKMFSDNCDRSGLLLARNSVLFPSSDLTVTIDGEEDEDHSRLGAAAVAVAGSVSGPAAFAIMLGEGGAHQVKRTNETSKGRIFSSTMTLEVFPSLDRESIQFPPSRFEVEYFTARVPGGSSANINSAGARIQCKVTGKQVQCEDYYDRDRNEAKAMEKLKRSLFEDEFRERLNHLATMKKEQRGTLSMADKFRIVSQRLNSVADKRLADVANRTGLDCQLLGSRCVRADDIYHYPESGEVWRLSGSLFLRRLVELSNAVGAWYSKIDLEAGSPAAGT